MDLPSSGDGREPLPFQADQFRGDGPVLPVFVALQRRRSLRKMVPATSSSEDMR